MGLSGMTQKHSFLNPIPAKVNCCIPLSFSSFPQNTLLQNNERIIFAFFFPFLLQMASLDNSWVSVQPGKVCHTNAERNIPASQHNGWPQVWWKAIAWLIWPRSYVLWEASRSGTFNNYCYNRLWLSGCVNQESYGKI